MKHTILAMLLLIVPMAWGADVNVNGNYDDSYVYGFTNNTINISSVKWFVNNEEVLSHNTYEILSCNFNGNINCSKPFTKSTKVSYTTNGYYDGGFYFNGQDGAILDMGNGSLYHPTTGNMTISFFIKTNESNQGHEIIRFNGAEGSGGYRLQRLTSNLFDFQVDNGTNKEFIYLGNSAFNWQDQQWYHVALTYTNSSNQSNVRLYINGLLVSGGIGSTNMSIAPYYGTARIGGYSTVALNGTLDDLKIEMRYYNDDQIYERFRNEWSVSESNRSYNYLDKSETNDGDSVIYSINDGTSWINSTSLTIKNREILINVDTSQSKTSVLDYGVSSWNSGMLIYNSTYRTLLQNLGVNWLSLAIGKTSNSFPTYVDTTCYNGTNWNMTNCELLLNASVNLGLKSYLGQIAFPTSVYTGANQCPNIKNYTSWMSGYMNRIKRKGYDMSNIRFSGLVEPSLACYWGSDHNYTRMINETAVLLNDSILFGQNMVMGKEYKLSTYNSTTFLKFLNSTPYRNFTEIHNYGNQYAYSLLPNRHRIHFSEFPTAIMLSNATRWNYFDTPAWLKNGIIQAGGDINDETIMTEFGQNTNPHYIDERIETNFIVMSLMYAVKSRNLSVIMLYKAISETANASAFDLIDITTMQPSQKYYTYKTWIEKIPIGSTFYYSSSDDNSTGFIMTNSSIVIINNYEGDVNINLSVNQSLNIMNNDNDSLNYFVSLNKSIISLSNMSTLFFDIFNQQRSDEIIYNVSQGKFRWYGSGTKTAKTNFSSIYISNYPPDTILCPTDNISCISAGTGEYRVNMTKNKLFVAISLSSPTDPRPTSIATTITDYDYEYTSGSRLDISGSGTGLHNYTGLSRDGCYDIYHNQIYQESSCLDNQSFDGMSNWSIVWTPPPNGTVVFVNNQTQEASNGFCFKFHTEGEKYCFNSTLFSRVLSNEYISGFLDQYLYMSGDYLAFNESKLEDKIEGYGYVTSSTETNESTRVNNIAGFSCGANQVVTSFGTDATPSCSADQTGNGTSNPLVPADADRYLYNSSTEIFFNESEINTTIDDRDTNLSSGGNVDGSLIVSGDVNVLGKLEAQNISNVIFVNISSGADLIHKIENAPDGAWIVVPDGNYWISRQINITKSLKITGTGIYGSYIRALPDFGGEAMFSIKDYVTFEDLNIDGQLRVDKIFNITVSANRFRNLGLQNWNYTAVYISGVYYNEFENVITSLSDRDGRYGVILDNAANENHFRGGKWYADVGFLINNSNNVNLEGVAVEHCMGCARSIGVLIDDSNDINLIANRYEGWDYGTYILDNSIGINIIGGHYATIAVEADYAESRDSFNKIYRNDVKIPSVNFTNSAVRSMKNIYAPRFVSSIGNEINTRVGGTAAYLSMRGSGVDYAHSYITMHSYDDYRASGIYFSTNDTAGGNNNDTWFLGSDYGNGNDFIIGYYGDHYDNGGRVAASVSNAVLTIDENTRNIDFHSNSLIDVKDLNATNFNSDGNFTFTKSTWNIDGSIEDNSTHICIGGC